MRDDSKSAVKTSMLMTFEYERPPPGDLGDLGDRQSTRTAAADTNEDRLRVHVPAWVHPLDPARSRSGATVTISCRLLDICDAAKGCLARPHSSWR